MPAGKKIRSSRHNSSMIVNTQNQSIVNGTSVDSTLTHKSIEASSSNIIPSSNEETKNLKRPLQNELDIDAKIKKIKETREEQFEDNSLNDGLNDENKIEERHMSLFIGKLDKIAESGAINGDKYCVPNESNYSSSEKDNLTNNFVNSPNNTGNNNQEISSPTKKTVYKEDCQRIVKKKSSAIKNDVNNSIPQVLKDKAEITRNSDDIDSHHQLITPLLSENVTFAENSKDKDLNGDSSSIKNLENNKNSDLHLSKNNFETPTKNGNEMIVNCEPENRNNRIPIGDENDEMIESDNASGGSSTIFDGFNGSNTNKESDYEDEIPIESTRKQFMKNMATNVLLQIFNEKNNIAELWSRFVHFKCLEYLTDIGNRGKQRREAEYVQRQQQKWLEKLGSLKDSVGNSKIVVRSHMDNFQNVPKKHKILRSVALQVNLSNLKENGCPIEPLRLVMPSLPSVSGPVDISSDEDVAVNKECIRPSSSKTQINTEKKQPSNVSRSTSPGLPRTPKKSKKKSTTIDIPIPPAIPINSAIINTDPIDLTEIDEDEVTNRLQLDKTIKIIKCPSINTSTSATSSTHLKTNLSTQASSKNVTYIVKTSTATGSNQLSTASSSKTVNIEPKKSLKPILIKSSRKFLPVQLSPVIDSKRLKPSTSTVNLASHQVNHLTPQFNSPQLIRPQIITPQIIRPQITRSPQTPKTLTVVQSIRPKLAMAQSTRPQLTMGQSTRPQFTTVQPTEPQEINQLPPVPPAIPIVYKHPAPLPPLPKQTSLPSWLKLPSAPVLTVKEQNVSEVLLSWVVPRCSNPKVASIKSYQIFSYVVNPREQPKTSFWNQIGVADALTLPMACTISQLKRRTRYCFAVRAVDDHTRVGPFSLPKSLVLS